MRSKERILEEYLVAGARLGDRSAIAKLVALRGPSLLSHATRLLGNRDDAHDAVQDAWIEIIRGLPQLRDDRSFPAWAYRIVTRRTARIISGYIKRRELATEVAINVDEIMPETENLVSDACAVRAAIKALPASQAVTISLFYLEEMNVMEVATALDIPIGTVKTRLMHARSKLIHALKGVIDE